MQLFRGYHPELTALARRHPLLYELAVAIDLGVGLGDDELLLLQRGQELDLVGDAALGHPPVRRLDEAELVGAGVRRERRDEADVRAFRRLDRADAAVVGRVHVAHFEPGALAGQAARSQRRQAALVG